MIVTISNKRRQQDWWQKFRTFYTKFFHTIFCVWIFLLISSRALESLRSTSGETVFSLAGWTCWYVMRDGLWSPLLVTYRPLTLRWKILFLETGSSRATGSSIAFLLHSWSSLLTLLFSSADVTSLSGVFSFDSAFIRLLSSRQYNSARYSENRFPAICLTSSNTWPHWHDLLDLGTTALQAKHCWTDMARMSRTRLQSKPLRSFAKADPRRWCFNLWVFWPDFVFAWNG